ncbi:ABC transporter permease, partial [Candidatus Parcubacteria bacterium]|nr:ABC transporter permease [Candidatus Parcubacteria bacterium]
MKFEIFKMAFESLLANKTRSFLSMLGIIIGVSTVIAVFAIGQGARVAVDEQFAGLSAKSIMVMRSMGRGATASSKLEINDVKIIREKAEHIALATGVIQGSSVVGYESNESSFSIVGTDLDFFEISKQEIVKGRIFTKEEADSKDRLIILGSDVVESLYEDESQIVGSMVTINGKKLEVIGYFAETGGSLGRTSKDEAVYIPYQTAESSILGSKGGWVMLTLEADEVDNVAIATE